MAALALYASVLTSFAVAAPAPAPAAEASQLDFEIVDSRPNSSLEKRTVGGVYICTDINWSGTCGYAVQPLNTCIHLDFPWYHTISSFGPDVGTACTWYSDYNCQNWLVTRVGNPGYADMSNFYNDQIGSFICYSSN